MVGLDNQVTLPKRRVLLETLRKCYTTGEPITAKLLKKVLSSVGAFLRDHAENIAKCTLCGGYGGKECELCCGFGCVTAKVANLIRHDGAFTIYPQLKNEAAVGLRPTQLVKLGAKLASKTAELSVAVIGQVVNTMDAVITFDAKKKKSLYVGRDDMLRRQADKYAAMDLKALTWVDVKVMLEEMEAYSIGDGVNERFSGLLTSYFATHDYDELAFLRLNWAKLKIVCQFKIMAPCNEGEYTDASHYSWINDKQPQLTIFWQPIDEIRDYFGDETALYFAWLGVYTHSLIWPSLTGLFTLIYGIFVNGTSDPDRNDLTMPYTLFIAMWSVVLLQIWDQRERELRFLWGTETLSESLEPRPAFEGVLAINFVTGKEVEVENPGSVKHSAMLVLAWICIGILCVITIGGALIAESIATLAPGWWAMFDENEDGNLDTSELDMLFERTEISSLNIIDSVLNGSNSLTLQEFEDRWIGNPATADISAPLAKSFDEVWVLFKYVILSAVTNLGLLTLFGVLYNLVSIRLNDWENHRLQSQYDFALVIKQSIFEFVNNYFIVFYISYLRQIQFFVGKAVSCEYSCLDALQIKLFIIFTGKTYGLKILEYGLPYFNLWRKSRIFRRVAEGFGVRSTDSDRDESTTLHVRGIGGEPCSCGKHFDKGKHCTCYGVYENVAALQRIFAAYGKVIVDGDVTKVRHRIDESTKENTSYALVTMADKAAAARALAATIILPAQGTKSATQLLVTAYSKSVASSSTGAMSGMQHKSLTVEEQSALEDWNGTFQDFAAMVTQFGYIALFAPACSLAPLLALLNNITEIRTDAYKLCNMFKRGEVRSADSIGAWNVVMKALAVGAVLVNATMLCFVGSQVAEHVHGKNSYETKSISNRWHSWQLWVLCIAMEHGVLLLKFAAMAVKSGKADWVDQARDTLDYQKQQMRQTSATLSGKRRELFGATALTPLATVAREIFNFLDQDGSGALNAEEVRYFCLLLGQKLDKKQTLSLIQDMRQYGESNIKIDRVERNETNLSKLDIDFAQFQGWWDDNAAEWIATLKETPNWDSLPVNSSTVQSAMRTSQYQFEPPQTNMSPASLDVESPQVPVAAQNAVSSKRSKTISSRSRSTVGSFLDRYKQDFDIYENPVGVSSQNIRGQQSMQPSPTKSFESATSTLASGANYCY